jgi:heme/copper-type cytochrome/quinol oxidase subunit 4
MAAQVFTRLAPFFNAKGNDTMKAIFCLFLVVAIILGILLVFGVRDIAAAG